MIYSGQTLCVTKGEDSIVELKFDSQGESVNKFNKQTLTELGEAVRVIAATDAIKGMVVTSGKESFIVGADITEFTALFSASEDELIQWLLQVNTLFSAIEDLPFPTVTAINGLALGGGLEMCLTTDFRVMATTAEIGLPEVKLGIFPGFGGTVRMPRLIGVDNAVEWVASGSQNNAEKSLKDGVVDAIVEPQQVVAAARYLLNQVIDGKIDYKAKRQEKLDPLKLPPLENMMAFQTCSAVVAQQAGKNYPSPLASVQAMQRHSGMKRDAAIEVEAKGFAKVAKTTVALSLVGLFLNDQELKRKAKKYEAQAKPIRQAAVLGAGIMGGGIAYQSAYKNTPIVMKDIAEKQLDLGMAEATKLLSKLVERKKIDAVKMGGILSKIRPTLNYGDFASVDIIVEAVVENEKVKKSVLVEVEANVRDDAIIASNTSTISINELAKALKVPERFAGMHFFNPVNKMPLVEIIRGEKTSDQTIATIVAYAKNMGKTPIVVNDCPGFFVNRVLFPYFGGFSILLKDGADFQAVDKVMEKFGWPMGPAFLMDVVGLDTGIHAAAVMAKGFPERMSYDFKDAFTVLFENKRLGQKNGLGFYKHETDKKGKAVKSADAAVSELLKSVCQPTQEFAEEEIIHRLMIPMCLEVVRCLEENIISSVGDADMALIYGLGFPPFRGGVFRYIDQMGVAKFVELCDRYASLGTLYQPTAKLREMAKNGQTFY